MNSDKSKKNIDVLKMTAHDLNNIFTSILNSVELLKIKIKDNDQSILLKNIENNSIRASEIVNELLLTEENKEKLKTRICIKTLISDLELTLKRSFNNSVKIELNLDKNIGDVFGNYSDLFRVLLNLCVNAKDASADKISISVYNTDVPKTKIYLNLNNKNFVVIKIADNGKGIEKASLADIFETGFSTKSSNKVSGLGLSIVKKIVDEHKGYIEVESELGKGTTFKIYFPVVKKVDKSVSVPTNKKILIAEDTKEIADELSELLKFENYIPTVAYDGEEVLNLLSERKTFDLFIIDKKMPGINGIELIKRIRRKDLLVPIILATGSMPSEEENSLSELNINKYIKKPYLFETLLENIRKLVQ